MYFEGILAVLGVLMFSVVVGLAIVELFWSIGSWINYVSTELSVSSTRLVGKVGLFNVERIDIPLEQITSVTIKSTLWGQIFNYATIMISAVGKTIQFDGIENAAEFQRYCLDLLKKKEESRMQKQAEAMSMAFSSAMKSSQPEINIQTNLGIEDKLKKLAELNDLKQQGIITDDEFGKLKSEIL